MRGTEPGARAGAAPEGPEALREALRQREQQCRELQTRLHELDSLREEIEQQDAALRESQRLLEESRDRYADLYDFAPVAYVTLDAHGVVLEANLTATSLVERARARWTGVPFATVVAERDRRTFLDHMRRCRAGDGPIRSEFALCPRPGREVPVEMISRPEGPVGPYRSVVLDLTERQRLLAERQRALDERRSLEIQEQGARLANESKDRFLALLSHELRTPLTPILAAAETLLAEPALLPPSWGAPLELIRRNAQMQARLVDDLLDLTRLGHGKLRLKRQPMDLLAVVQEVLEDVAERARARKVEISLQVRAADCGIEADPLRIRQLVHNLVGNALKFSPEGSEVGVLIDHPRRGWVRLEVSDAGPGLTREELGRIFEPFEQGSQGQLQHDGLGIGLAIAKGIVDAHGGSIQAYSAGPGTGARFAVDLPAAPHASASAAPMDHPAPPASRPDVARAPDGKRILIVEDHADSAEALRALLEQQGYEVSTASSVAQALEVARQGCDLLISDIRLPDGSGHSLLGQLPQPPPAIALSGFGSRADLEHSREAGFVEHLVKPVAVADLMAAIGRALSKQQGPPVPRE
jgi:PAS domain S-box-containing protein